MALESSNGAKETGDLCAFFFFFAKGAPPPWTPQLTTPVSAILEKARNVQKVRKGKKCWEKPKKLRKA